jgi:GntR family transcriptional regulator
MVKSLARRSAGRGPERAPRFITDEVPLYYQLGGLLREKVVSGEFAVGARIPTEADLVGEYGVSRITVRQALGALEKEGLIRREAGRGTFVTDHQPFTGTLKVEGSLDDIISLGLVTQVKVLDLRTVKASAAEAEALGLEAGALLTRCTRLRLYHGEPYSYIVNDLPHEVGKRIARSDFKGVLLRVLEDKLHIAVRDARQTVRAALADATLARLLETRIGAPLLAVDRLILTDGGRPVERVHTYYRSDIYSLTVHLTRHAPMGGSPAGWALKGKRRER